ncbi:MAG: hypothetical protein IKS97_01200 [Fibrobacter sp.]|nr:hypothetical protein [Fibrobacter sp.]
MKQILAMSKPNAVCAIHGATANGFFKDTKIFDFNFAGLFSSAFLFSTKKVDLSARSCPNKFGRDARLMINFLPSVILSAAKDPGQFNTRFLINN